jgi:hypothetical protein
MLLRTVLNFGLIGLALSGINLVEFQSFFGGVAGVGLM